MSPSKAAAKKKAPPKVRARRRGTYTELRNSIAGEYKDKHPEKEVRWVYDPEHDPRYSRVRHYGVRGYELVDGETEGLTMPHGQSGTKVRLGDAVLMAVDRDVRAETDRELKADAEADARKSKDAYDRAIAGLSTKEHEMVPVGGVTDVVEEKTMTIREKEE